MRDRHKERSQTGTGSVSATEAQNHFGEVLGRAAREGAVFIRKYNRPAAVVLSMDAYRKLRGQSDVDLDELSREFDELLARLQTEEAAAATDALFDMEADELGQAAVRDTRARSD